MFELDWLKKWAKYTPNRFALRDYEKQADWNYFEFNAGAESLAEYFRDNYNIKKGDTIAVFSKNRGEYIFLFFAAIKLGAILTPLNFRLTPLELEGLLEDSKPSLFIYEACFSEEISKLKYISENSASVLAIDNLSNIINSTPSDKISVPNEITIESPVMILYTSGTTGVPKGAIISHKMLFYNSINTELRLDITSMDHTQGYAPLFHTGGWNVLFTPFVHHGASHTILSKFDPKLILELIEREKSTILFGVPTMLQMISDLPEFESADFTSLRYAVVGGAPMPIPLINRWHEKKVYIRQGYGLTEVGPNCFSLHQDDAIRKIGSIGFPNFYIEAKIANENGEELGEEIIGELWLKSPVVTPGYLNKPEETSKAKSGDWFKTGDMVKRDSEGFYYVMDRKKNMYISGGENVYPAEIERAILEISSIKETAVIGVPDDKWGEVGLAFIVCSENYDCNEEFIRKYLLERLAKYKIPKHFRFIDEIPKNDSGKIDRINLKSLITNYFKE